MLQRVPPKGNDGRAREQMEPLMYPSIRPGDRLAVDLSELGIKMVSQPVPKEVQGQDCEEYSQSRKDSDPPGYRQVIPAIGHHDSP